MDYPQLTLKPITNTSKRQQVSEPQEHSGWCNDETECIADEVFGSRQTFCFVLEVISEGKNLDAQADILCGLMTQWLGEDWKEERPFAWNEVNWKELAQEIREYQWGDTPVTIRKLADKSTSMTTKEGLC